MAVMLGVGAAMGQLPGFSIGDEQREVWEDVLDARARVELVCSENLFAEDDSLPSCPSVLSPLTQRKGVTQMDAKGAALAFPDVMERDTRKWAGLYFTGSRCATTRVCLKRKRCTVRQVYRSKHPRQGELLTAVFVETYRVTMSTHYGGSRYEARTTACAMCVPDECTGEQLSCPNGRIVGSASGLGGELVSRTRDINGEVVRLTKPLCEVACPAGTWLTCQDDTECMYVSPSAEAIREISGNQTGPGASAAVRRWIQKNRQAYRDGVPVSLDLGVPVDRCYPCHLAANLRHFGRRVTTDAVLLGQGYLQFECPGGSLGPRMCGSNEVSQIETSSPCQCKPGWFRDGQGVCQPCEAGHRCRFGATLASGMEACPVDTFASGGSAECVACGKDAGRCGAHEALTRCSGVGFQGRDSECVDCNTCMEVSGRQVPGTKPCLHLV